MSTTRLEAIRKAADRMQQAKRRPNIQPGTGKWMRLEHALGSAANGAAAGLHFRKGPWRAWGLLVPGIPEIGAAVQAPVGAHGSQRRSVKTFYVWQVVVPATTRGDGCSVVKVKDKRPKDKPLAAQPKAEAPMPTGTFVSAGPVNPRECTECGERCRPGAGVCDECRATLGEKERE